MGSLTEIHPGASLLPPVSPEQQGTILRFEPRFQIPSADALFDASQITLEGIPVSEFRDTFQEIPDPEERLERWEKFEEELVIVQLKFVLGNLGSKERKPLEIKILKTAYATGLDIGSNNLQEDAVMALISSVGMQEAGRIIRRVDTEKEADQKKAPELRILE